MVVIATCVRGVGREAWSRCAVDVDDVTALRQVVGNEDSGNETQTEIDDESLHVAQTGCDAQTVIEDIEQFRDECPHYDFNVFAPLPR